MNPSRVTVSPTLLRAARILGVFALVSACQTADDAADEGPVTCASYCALFHDEGCAGSQCSSACSTLSQGSRDCRYAFLLEGDCTNGGFFSAACQ